MSEDTPFSDELVVAARLARAAGAAILDVRRDGIEASRKADRTLVTNADMAAERIVTRGLAERFPRDGVVTEESGVVAPPASGRTWVVDPLDGTKGFARGGRGFCVMIGMLEAGDPVLGALYLPLDDVLVVAERGQGCYVQEQGGPAQRAHVSERTDWGSLRLVVSESMSPERQAEVLALTGLAQGPAIHSAGVKVSLLVRGLGDVYYSHHGLSAWDTIAPGVALAEAGGVMTTLDGAPLTYEPSRLAETRFGRILASNGTRHADLLAHFSSLVEGHDG